MTIIDRTLDSGVAEPGVDLQLAPEAIECRGRSNGGIARQLEDYLPIIGSRRQRDLARRALSQNPHDLEAVDHFAGLERGVHRSLRSREV